MKVRRWLRRLVVGCTTVLLLSTPCGPAEAKFGPGAARTSDWVRIETFDDGLWIGTVEVTVKNKGSVAQFHARIVNRSYGINSSPSWVGNGETLSFRFYPDRHFASGSVLCAEVWRHEGRGRYGMKGRPCLRIGS